MKMTDGMGFFGFFILGLIVAKLAIIGLIVYVVWHFVSKYW